MMKNFRTILFLFISLVLLGCQAKGGDSTGGLISGHLPATNSFTLSPLATKTYTATETISFTMNFPFDLTVTGNPRLRLTVGATTRYATYAAQGDLRKLVFNYTFIAGENDTNGIDVNALELNGATITFDKDGTPTNADVSTFASQNLAHVKVDSTSPTITAFSLTNIPGMYNEGDVLLFRMTFSETVVVTGTPKFVMALDSGNVDVNYVSGTGSNILMFSYTVGPTASDVNGFNSITSPLVNGTIKDIVGNNSSLNFAAYTAAVVTYSSAVHVSGTLPYIVATDFPDNKTYVAAEVLDFILEFDQAVTVTGTPYLNIDINGVTKQATYTAGSTTKFLTFRYTTVPGDVDANGITVSPTIVRGAGEDIAVTGTPALSFFGDTLNNAIPLPDTSGIILNAIQPQPIAVNAIDTTVPTWGGPAVDNVWMIGQEFNISVTFNTPMFVSQNPGAPYIPITIGGVTRQASYLSGGNGQTSLIFRYVVQEGDLDMDGAIDVGSIVLTTSSITDASNTNTLLTLPVTSIAKRIDGVRPIVSTVTPPSNQTYSQVTPYNAAAMVFTLNWSEAVNYAATTAINMDVGGTNVSLNNTNNNVAGITHAPGSLAGRNDSNGVTLTNSLVAGAVVKDQAGNAATNITFPGPNTTSINVDTTKPTVVSVTPITANGTYNVGQYIEFSVVFSEAVTPTLSGSYPRIALTLDSGTKELLPTTFTSSTTHTFRYTVTASDLDTDGIVIANRIEQNGTGYIRDVGRNDITASGNFSNTYTLPNTSGIRVDTVAPAAPTAVASAAKTYVSGEQIQITVTYAENVDVDTTSGTPSIAVNFDFGTNNLVYVSGSGTTALVFSRTLDGTHFDMNGLPASVGSITLNGGTIRDAGRNNAPLAFSSAVNLSTTYVSYPEVKVWVKSDFLNKAPPATALTISSGGPGVSRACNGSTGTCRVFNNAGDFLSLGAGLGSVSAIYIAFETPSSVLTDRDLFTSDVYLRSNGFTSLDIRTQQNSSANVDNTAYGTNVTSHNTNFGASETHVLQLLFQSTQSYSGTVIDNSYRGAIGEVIVIDGALNATERDNIRNYLNGIY